MEGQDDGSVAGKNSSCKIENALVLGFFFFPQIPIRSCEFFLSIYFESFLNLSNSTAKIFTRAVINVDLHAD